MKYDPQKHHRRSIRLKGYDYAQAGAYFVTICTQDRTCLFGDVVDGEMRVNPLGEIVQDTWLDLPNHVDGLILDAFVVMPNHVHGIVIIAHGDVPATVGAGPGPAPTKTTTKKRHGLPEIVRQFKTFSARRINAYRHTPGIPVWQRNYYEHIIRDADSLHRIRQYIANNPLKWGLDREKPEFRTDGSEPAPTGLAPIIGTEPWRI